MAARAAGIFGLVLAMALLILAWHDEPFFAIANLCFATFVLYIAIMLLRFPDHLRPFASAGFSQGQMIFLWSVPIGILGFSIIVHIMIFQNSSSVKEFRSPLILMTTLYFYLYKPNRKRRVS